MLAPPGGRLAEVQVSPKAPELTTSKARAMGIETVLASYSTLYSGTADRTRNLQLAVSLLDGSLVPPGGTFSLNEAVGPRTLEQLEGSLRATEITLSDEVLTQLDDIFPGPGGAAPEAYAW